MYLGVSVVHVDVARTICFRALLFFQSICVVHRDLVGVEGRSSFVESLKVITFIRLLAFEIALLAIADFITPGATRIAVIVWPWRKRIIIALIEVCGAYVVS